MRVTCGADGDAAAGAASAAEPVRGYDRDFERVAGRLRDAWGCGPRIDAVRRGGARGRRAARGRPSKVRVALEPGTRSDVAAGLVLLPLADIAEANMPGTLDDLDTEFLHDLRVSIRRARSVLRELAGVIRPTARARVRAELEWAQAVTGPVRDLDVQLLEWDELTASADGGSSSPCGGC